VRVIDDLPSRRAEARNVMVIGEVIGVHIRDEMLTDGRVDAAAFRPVARLGYMEYATVRETWEMQRPG
jgi:flavin reductase (DIM6/NTAB) family NADH-FMN oxidoreductase RutF